MMSACLILRPDPTIRVSALYFPHRGPSKESVQEKRTEHHIYLERSPKYGKCIQRSQWKQQKSNDGYIRERSHSFYIFFFRFSIRANSSTMQQLLLRQQVQLCHNLLSLWESLEEGESQQEEMTGVLSGLYLQPDTKPPDVHLLSFCLNHELLMKLIMSGWGPGSPY